MNAIGALRALKHRMFLRRKRIVALGGPRMIAERRLRGPGPFRYDPAEQRRQILDVVTPKNSSFIVDHLLHPIPQVAVSAEPPPRVLWLIWMGPGALSANRERGLRILREENPDLDVRLVTDDTIADWEQEAAPLPAEFWRLGYTHRSDVLRAYLMHHHGGAYSDIKPIRGRFSDLFALLDDDPEAWIASIPEVSVQNVSGMSGPFAEEQRLWYDRTPWPAAFICRPGTPFTHEWWNEIVRRLRYFTDLLPETPEGGSQMPEGDPSYPIPWNQLHGGIFSPLALKHNAHVRLKPVLDIHGGDYR